MSNLAKNDGLPNTIDMNGDVEEKTEGENEHEVFESLLAVIESRKYDSF